MGPVVTLATIVQKKQRVYLLLNILASNHLLKKLEDSYHRGNAFLRKKQIQVQSIKSQDHLSYFNINN